MRRPVPAARPPGRVTSHRLRRIAAPCHFVVLSLLAPAAGGQAPATATMVASTSASLPPGAIAGARASATAARASRVATPPTLDGRTDDPAWASAQVIDQFLGYDPNEGVKWSYWINP